MAVQDRYAGDVGDFGKFALLRALSVGVRLGVCWCLTDGAREANNDGRHLAYLQRPERFRALDPELFDALASFVADIEAGRKVRRVASLEEIALLPPDTLFHGALCPLSSPDRHDWAAAMAEAMEGANLVFLDPDNGLEGATLTPKSAAISELISLRRPGRAVLLYHHQTRRSGGAAVEATHVAARLGEAGFDTVDAVRLRPYSSRFYFLLDAEPELRNRLHRFAARWGRSAQLFPALL